MKTGERLKMMDEINQRNAAMEAEFKRDHDRRTIKALEEAHAKAASVHRTIEIYAGAIMESLDLLAAFHGEKRSDLLELLMHTAWALEQYKAQEG